MFLSMTRSYGKQHKTIFFAKEAQKGRNQRSNTQIKAVVVEIFEIDYQDWRMAIVLLASSESDSLEESELQHQGSPNLIAFFGLPSVWASEQN